MIRRVVYDVEFSVHVKEKLNPCDSVLVTGSCEQLGEWSPTRCIPLNRADKTDEGEIWTTNIKIYGSQKISYRYLIAQIVRIDDDVNLIVKKWETFKNARQLSLEHLKTESAEGAAAIENDPPEEFPAVFGCYRGECRTDIGWLTGQTEIQLRFHSNPLQIWAPKLRNSKISLKVAPIDLNYHQENEEILSDVSSQIFTPTSKVFIQSAILRLPDCEANFQSDYGAVIEKDDYMVVKIQTFEPENVAYHIDFYLVDETTPMRKHIGFAYILPIHSNLELADNKHLNRIVPIIGLKHNPIGQIRVDVLLITPLEALPQKFLVSSSKYWRQGRRPVNVGHRGLGKTNTEHVPAKHQPVSPYDPHKQRPTDPTGSQLVQTKFVSENTLASFKGAFQLGFDFVEFDVQLAKDKIPVVYHDFQVAITLKRKGHEAELFVVPVKDLTLPQLQSLRIYHASKEGEVRKGDEELDDEEQTALTPHQTTMPTFTPMATNGEGDQLATHKPGQQNDDKTFRSLFPTLQELFEKLDPHLGFNVEIKYAMEYRQGGSEQNHFFERNEYIDCILRCLITYAGKRVIVLSTFDPDCASMLRRKQTLFPVLFLTQGEKGDWPQYLDVRTWSIGVGLCFCVAEQLTGLAAPALDILTNKEFVKHVKDNGKLLFIWGDEASDKEVSKSLLDLRVDGLIFDHVAEVKEEYSTTENLFVAEEREELEVLNNFRQKQLELQHQQLLQELERLKSARETTTTGGPSIQSSSSSMKTIMNSGPEQSTPLDSNFKQLM